MPLTEIEKTVRSLASSHEHARRREEDEKRNLERSKMRSKHALTAQKIVQEVAQVVQQKVHDQMASVVSRCLETVFDEPYAFRIHFEQKRGKTEARLVFERNGMEVDPLTASGGGVVDVASFALRLSCLVLSRPRLRRTVVLDEPFRFLSRGFRPKLRGLLGALADELGIQFIFVTHMDDLRVGKVVEVG